MSFELLHINLLQDITDAEFQRHVTGSLSRCKWLCASECSRLSDAAFINLTPLQCSSICSLDLTFVKISNNAIRSISRSCVSLRKIALDCCFRITDESMLYLADSLSKTLIDVSVNSLELITDKGIEALSQGLPLLQSLSLDRCKSITDRTLKSLSSCPAAERLQQISLTSCIKITDEGVMRLVSKATNLEYLSLSNCPLVSDSSVFAIASSLFNLSQLKLSGLDNVSDRGMAFLQKHSKSLQFLDITFCQRITALHFEKYKPVLNKLSTQHGQKCQVKELRLNGSVECCKAIKDERLLSLQPKLGTLSQLWKTSDESALGDDGWCHSQLTGIVSRGSSGLADSRFSPRTPISPCEPISPLLSVSANSDMPRRKGYLAKTTKVEFSLFPPYKIAAPASQKKLESSKNKERTGLPPQSPAPPLAQSKQLGSGRPKSINMQGKISRNHLNGFYDIEYYLPNERMCKASQIRLLPGSKYVKGKMENVMVDFNYREHGSWIPGKITRERCDSGTFDIAITNLCEAINVPEELIRVNGMSATEYLTSETKGPNSMFSAGSTTYTSPAEFAGRAWLQKKNASAARLADARPAGALIFSKHLLEIAPPHYLDDPTVIVILRT